jgi:hypothetical protein
MEIKPAARPPSHCGANGESKLATSKKAKLY